MRYIKRVLSHIERIPTGNMIPSKHTGELYEETEKIYHYRIEEAPEKAYKNGRWIHGYNQPSNHDMLTNDGYILYDGDLSLEYLEIGDNGDIIEHPPERTLFSQLEIRRACRALGLEPKLDTLIDGSEEFSKDWIDAAVIDMTDPQLLAALALGSFTNEEIETIKSSIL